MFSLNPLNILIFHQLPSPCWRKAWYCHHHVSQWGWFGCSNSFPWESINMMIWADIDIWYKYQWFGRLPLFTNIIHFRISFTILSTQIAVFLPITDYQSLKSPTCRYWFWPIFIFWSVMLLDIARSPNLLKSRKLGPIYQLVDLSMHPFFWHLNKCKLKE